jgi:hypothetical protein
MDDETMKELVAIGYFLTQQKRSLMSLTRNKDPTVLGKRMEVKESISMLKW